MDVRCVPYRERFLDERLLGFQATSHNYMIQEIEDLREDDGTLLGIDLVGIEDSSLCSNRFVKHTHITAQRNAFVPGGQPYLLQDCALLQVQERVVPRCGQTRTSTGLSTNPKGNSQSSSSFL